MGSEIKKTQHSVDGPILGKNQSNYSTEIIYVMS